MLKLIYHAADQAIASRLISDLTAAGMPVEDMTRGAAQAKGDVLIAIINPTLSSDQQNAVEAAIIQALDNSEPIVPITVAGGATLPRLIDHLPPVNMTEGYAFESVRARVEAASIPGAAMPLKVLTPSARRANNRIGWVVAIAAIFMFAVGLYGVGVLDLQAPADEFTNANQTQNAMIRTEIAPVLSTMEGFLPQNPEQAFIYPATLLAQPTRYWPYIAATATQYAATSSVFPATLTPTPAR